MEDMDDEEPDMWAIQTAPQLPNNKDMQSFGTATIPNHPAPLLPMNPFSSLFDLTGGPLFSTCSFNEACSTGNVEVDRHRAQVDKLMNEINNLRTQVVDSTVIVKKLFQKLSKAKEDLNQAMTSSSLRLKRVQKLEKQREALFAYYNGMLRAPTHDRSQQEQGLPDYLTTKSHLKHLCEFFLEKQRTMIRGLKQDEEEGTEQSVGEKSSVKNVVNEAEREIEPLRALFKFLIERLKTEREFTVYSLVSTVESEKAEQVVMKQDQELDLENEKKSEPTEMRREEDELDEWKDQLKSPDTEYMEKFHLVMDEVRKDECVRDTDSFLNLCVEKAGCSNPDEQVQNGELGLRNGRESKYIEMNKEEDEPNSQPKPPSPNTRLDEMGAFHVLNPESDFILRHVLIDDQNNPPYEKRPCLSTMGLGFPPAIPELNSVLGCTEPIDFPSSPEQPPTSSIINTSGKSVSPDSVEYEMSCHLKSNEQVQNRPGMSSDDDTSPSSGKRSHKNCCRSS